MLITAAGAVTDVNTEHPDKKSIMMYLMCCYEVLTAEKKPTDNVRNVQNKTIIIKFFSKDLRHLLAAYGVDFKYTACVLLTYMFQLDKNFIELAVCVE